MRFTSRLVQQQPREPGGQGQGQPCKDGDPGDTAGRRGSPGTGAGPNGWAWASTSIWSPTEGRGRADIREDQPGDRGGAGRGRGGTGRPAAVPRRCWARSSSRTCRGRSTSRPR